MLERICVGFQSISATFLIACAANFGVVIEMKTSAPLDLQLDDVAVDGGLGGLVAFLGDHHRRLGAEPVLQALEVILTEIVVLIQDGDLAIRLFLHQELGVDARLALVAGRPADSPGEALRIVPLGGARANEQLRHLLRSQILLDRGVGRRADRTEHCQHLVALDQLADLLDRLRRAVAVVIADEVDLAAVDAALGVDLLEIGFGGPADHAKGGRGSAVGHGAADLDFGIGRAGIVFLLRERGSADGNAGNERRHERGSSCFWSRKHHSSWVGC